MQTFTLKMKSTSLTLLIYLTKTPYESFNIYANAAITNGGRGTMAFWAAHEFGHSMDTSKSRKVEHTANNYAKTIFPFFNKIGIDIPSVRIR